MTIEPASLPVSKRFSVCQHVLRLGDLAQDVAAAEAAGASAFSLNASDFGDVAPEQAARILDGSGLAVSSYIDPQIMFLGPARPDLDAIARAFDVAAALGAPCCLFIAGALVGGSAAAADEHLVDALGRISERTRGSGVRPMLEPLHPIARELSYVHTVGHALSIVRQVPGTGIVVDTGASWWERDLVDDVAANLDVVVAIQITDVRADEMSRRTYVRERCSAGSAVPVADLVRKFVASGYQGWFEHEVLAPADRDARLDMVRADRIWFEQIWA